MRQLKQFKLSMPNTGLMFLIAGMAVANYSYDNYKMKYMSSSSKYVDTNAKDILNERLEPNAFVSYNQNEGIRDKSKPGNLNTSTNENGKYPLPLPKIDSDRSSESGLRQEMPIIKEKSSHPPQKKQLKAEKIKKADKHVKTNYI